MSPIYFFVPKEHWPIDIDPDSPRYKWSPARLGKWNWTIQTWQYLKDAGYDCSLVQHLPEEGVILSHRSFLQDSLKPGPKQLLVCILAERNWHPWAQFHILQNPIQHRRHSRSVSGLLERLLLGGESSAFIRYWPQPGLIPRDSSRGDRFENLVFMGVEKNIAPEFRSAAFLKEIRNLGLNWLVIHDKERWPDFRTVDAVLAVRSFGKDFYDNKPATKLYNAWLAGVVPLLGAESAFRHEGKRGVDYVELRSCQETIEALRRLRTDAELRRMIVERGADRAKDLTTERFVERWLDLVQGRLVPLHRSWTDASSGRKISYFALRRLTHVTRVVHKKVLHRWQMVTGRRSRRASLGVRVKE